MQVENSPGSNFEKLASRKRLPLSCAFVSTFPCLATPTPGVCLWVRTAQAWRGWLVGDPLPVLLHGSTRAREGDGGYPALAFGLRRAGRGQHPTASVLPRRAIRPPAAPAAGRVPRPGIKPPWRMRMRQYIVARDPCSRVRLIKPFGGCLVTDCPYFRSPS